MLTVVVGLAVVAFVLSVVLTWSVREVGRRAMLLDSAGAAGQEKIRRGVPNIGGVAIFWSITAPLLAGLTAVWLMPGVVARVAPPSAAHLKGIREQTPMALGLLGAMLALHVMGLIDDRRPMPPWPKLALMFAVSAGVAWFFDVRLLTFLDARAGGPWLSILLTVLWLVAATNAMNMMDNMDGLAAGVGASASMTFLVVALMNGQWFVSAMLALLAGSLLGFFVFNAPRPGGATIFMGDGGSLVAGFLLGFLSVRTTYLAEGASWYAVLMPLCILAVPIYDMASVVLIRLSQGRSPFVGDRQHFSHRLLAAGLTVPRALIVLIGCTAITGVSGIMLSGATGWQAALIGVQVLLVLVVIALYEHGKGWPPPGSASPHDRKSRT